MSDLIIPDLGPPQPFPRTRNGLTTSPSTTRAPRQRLPSRNSTVSYAGSEASQSEIHAPVPRRHHLLQQSEAHRWLHSPDLSPTSSRAVSPTALKSHRRMLSFSSLSGRSNKAAEEPRGWARQWVRWMHRSGLRVWVVPVSVLGAAWVKWVVGLGDYSGYAAPPMYGDYEAQRHWLEVTLNVPIREWYTYDLDYWGLDYPPLTAYHAWFCGKIATWIDPSWVALHSSRGIETPSSKVFMRATVLISDLLIYTPAVILFVRRYLKHRSGRTQHVALLTILLQPALILIDMGHFQYNAVMLGLALLSLDSLVLSSDLTAAVFFVLSLGYKQMALYYAPAIGSYLLGKCVLLGSQHGRILFIRLACTTLLTLAILFLPWLGPRAIRGPISRIFPFNRGLFEDKVSNFWCASDVFVKWRRWLDTKSLLRLSTTLTACGFTPAVWGLLRGAWRTETPITSKDDKQEQRIETTPTLSLLPYALLTSALSFFLFSFQVHEKTVLLPLLPATLILAGAESGGGGEDWEWGVLFNNVAMFSMWPLLKREGLALQYFAITLLWNRAIGYNPLALRSGWLVRTLSLFACSAMLILHCTEALFTPPARYPDLFAVLNVLVCATVFGCVWLWSIKRGIEVGWAISGLPANTNTKERQKVRISTTSSNRNP